ncbi:hypothetical protein RUND412_007665 [Rhizina undulata]
MEIDSRKELILEEYYHKGDPKNEERAEMGADARQGKVEKKFRFIAVGKSDQYFDHVYIFHVGKKALK